MNPFAALAKSFYSARFYRQVQHWRGTALFYLGWVLAMCWIPVFVKAHFAINQFVQLVETQVVPQLPVIRFENGRVSTPENRAYRFRFVLGRQTVNAVIDTSGQYSSLDGQEAQILLTRDKLYVRQRTGEVRMYDLSQSRAGPMVLDQERLEKMIRILRRWVVAGMYFGIYALSYLKRLMQALLIALAGLLLAFWLEAALDLGELFSLAIVSMTPAMILETALNWVGASFRFQWMVWALLIAAYFIFAVNAASDQTAADDEIA